MSNEEETTEKKKLTHYNAYPRNITKFINGLIESARIPSTNKTTVQLDYPKTDEDAFDQLLIFKKPKQG